jgi:DNA-binding NarL/FixJ family response regulator
MSLDRDLFGADRVADDIARVLVADHDPISRHVLTRVLGASAHLEVVGSVNNQQPLRQWPLDRVGVVVLAIAPREDATGLIRQLAQRQVKVLVIGTGWTQRRLDAAFAAGATGCLVKNIKVAGVTSAIRAVASGHTVLSPELRTLYARPQAPSPSPAPAGATHLLAALTSREREVLRNLAEGLSTAETAVRLRVSPATVKSHVSHVLAKLGARNRLEAVLVFQQSWNSDGESLGGSIPPAGVGRNRGPEAARSHCTGPKNAGDRPPRQGVAGLRRSAGCSPEHRFHASPTSVPADSTPVPAGSPAVPVPAFSPPTARPAATTAAPRPPGPPATPRTTAARIPRRPARTRSRARP